MSLKWYVVLDDGETFSAIDGCQILAYPANADIGDTLPEVGHKRCFTLMSPADTTTDAITELVRL